MTKREVRIESQTQSQIPSRALRLFSLALADRSPEDVVVLAIVVPELELRNVQREVLAADFVERPHDAALEDAPETFNRVRVDRADNVLALGVVNDAMREFFAERAIAAPCIGADQAYFFGNRAAHEGGEGRGIDVLDERG